MISNYFTYIRLILKKFADDFFPLWFSTVFVISSFFFHQDEILLAWVNPIYLNPDIVSGIQEQFEEQSEIQLPDFMIVGL